MLCSLQGVTAPTALEHRESFISRPAGHWVILVFREPAATSVSSLDENRHTRSYGGSTYWLLRERGWLLRTVEVTPQVALNGLESQGPGGTVELILGNHGHPCLCLACALLANRFVDEPQLGSPQAL